MTEEKKEQIKKRILIIESVLALLMVIYLVYVVVTKTSNSILFSVLSGVILFTVLILNDIVEPYLTKVFDEMNDFRKEAYKKYVLCDAISYLGLLIFIITFGSDDSTFMFVSICMFVIGARKKNEYRGAFLGKITREDVEAAKEAAEAEAIEAEAIEVEATEVETVEETVETEETAENIEE